MLKETESQSIQALKKGIDRRLKEMDESIREALKMRVEPVAMNYVESVSIKVSSDTVIKITNKKRLACTIQMQHTQEIDEMDGMEE